MAALTRRYGPIEVFRAGTFKPMGGEAQTITEANLREIASAYDRDTAPAPVVIGHPETDTPAFGWVEHLYVEGGILKATLEDIVLQALLMAVWRRKPKGRVLIHSDQGSQFTSMDWAALPHVPTILSTR